MKNILSRLSLNFHYFFFVAVNNNLGKQYIVISQPSNLFIKYSFWNVHKLLNIF